MRMVNIIQGYSSRWILIIAEDDWWSNEDDYDEPHNSATCKIIIMR